MKFEEKLSYVFVATLFMGMAFNFDIAVFFSLWTIIYLEYIQHKKL